MADFDKNNIGPRAGIRQDTRLANAPQPHKARIDDRSLQELILFSAGLARLIQFFNEQNEPSGDWSVFFNDELVILSTILQLRTEQIENQFKQDLGKYSRFRRLQKQQEYLPRCLRQIYELAWMLDQWVQNTRNIEQFTGQRSALRDELLQTIQQSLERNWADFAQIVQALHKAQPEGIIPKMDFEAFSVVWRLSPDADPLPELPQTQADIAYRLGRIFQAFYEALLYLRGRALTFMEASLKQDSHFPEMALLVGFLRLYEYPQESINRITKRYLDFYYREVLQQSPLAPIAEKVYLQFNLNENAHMVRLHAGEPLSAGEYADGENIIYHTDDSAVFNRATIRKLLTAHFEYQILTIRGVGQPFMRQVQSMEIPMQEVTPSPVRMRQYRFAPFGNHVHTDLPTDLAPQIAQLGFAVASPGLYMSEGEREVRIKLRFSPDTFQQLQTSLEDLSASLSESEDELFIKMFLSAFNIALTSSIGWYAIEKYVATRNEEAAELDVLFSLNNLAPAIIGYDANLHEGNYATHLPMVRFTMNSDAYFYPYTLLKFLEVQQISITTDVRGVRDLVLQSQAGALSADSPFYPFGSSPSVGSYLIIGKNEIFQKSIDALEIEIEWFGLPTNNAGMEGHYRQYDLPIDNTVFEANISVLSGGRWLPDKATERQNFTLFRSIDAPQAAMPQPNFALSPHTTISRIDINKLKLPPNYEEVSTVLSYNHLAQRGFVKLELSSPEFGFAHNIYPAVLSETVIANTQSSWAEYVRNGFRKSAPLPMPNQPYTPQISKISLNYRSSAQILLSDRSVSLEESEHQGKFFHIRPFGINLTYPDVRQPITHLLPLFEGEGSLFIGLGEVNAPQTLTILFEMAGGVGLSSDEEKPILEWSYLSQDQWLPLPASKILQDQTDGFIKTGIITLELPYDINTGNTLLDGQYSWLRVSVIKNIRAASMLQNVCTQVVKATLEYNPAHPEQLEKPLAAFTIDTPVNNLVGVQEIRQPLIGFGGQAGEKEAQFYTRLSERLRHKNRAITPQDYERLVLAAFPQIFQATCLPNMTSQKLHAPGAVLVVVTPRPQGVDNVQDLQVSSEVLYEIKEYLQQFIAPFVHIEVRNISYERVKVLCDVKLAVNYSPGYYVQKLGEDLNQYLMQNIVGNRQVAALGGRINISDVLSFMRTLSYVDFITRFSMVQVAQDFRGQYILLDTAHDTNVTFLQASKPWSVLIPAETHQIVPLDHRVDTAALPAGIQNLQIGIDFVVS